MQRSRFRLPRYKWVELSCNQGLHADGSLVQCLSVAGPAKEWQVCITRSKSLSMVCHSLLAAMLLPLCTLL